MIDDVVNNTYGMPASLFFILVGAAVCIAGDRTERDRQQRLRNKLSN